MPSAPLNGLDLYYEAQGASDAPVILLIMGLGGQLTMWPPGFVDDLVAAGYRVVRFDNRDVGLSSKFDEVRLPHPVLQMLARRVGWRLATPYDLADMARDAEGLLDHLGIEAAHVVGISMGGMIAQHLAAGAPGRVRSLTAVMSTTGNPRLPRPKGEILKRLLRQGPAPIGRDAIIDRGVETFALIGTPGEDHNTNGVRDQIAVSFDRNHHPSGPLRQIAAILSSGDFRSVTRRVRAPTLVIHGTVDPLVSPLGGRDIARNIPGARLELIEEMGHDLVPRHRPRILRHILDHVTDVETGLRS